MSTSMAEVTELMVQVSQYVHSLQLLHDLCLVNRRFYHIFTPRLWQHLEFDFSNYRYFRCHNAFSAIMSSPGLQHVQQLTFSDVEITRPGENVPHHFNRKLTALIRKLETLESFAFNGALISHDSLAALSRIASLKHLHLTFDRSMDDWFHVQDLDHITRTAEFEGPDSLVFGDPEQHLARFHNLTSLTLRDMSWHVMRWQPCILELLLNSPGLEHLNLSFSDAAVEQAQADISPETLEESYRFVFHHICDRYATMRQEKLKIKSLVLGFVNAAPRLVDKLRRVLDLTSLEVIDVSVSPRDNLGQLLPRVETPRLRKLFLDWIPDNIKQAIQHSFDETDDRRMLFDIDSRKPYSTTGMLCFFAERNSPSIAGIRLPRDGRDYFDLLLSMFAGNASLTYLSIPTDPFNIFSYVMFDIEAQMDTLRELIARLPALQALRLDWPLEAEEHFPEHVERLDLEEFLNYVINDSASLRYVKAGQRAWSVLPNGLLGASRLRELDRWEQRVEEPAWIW